MSNVLEISQEKQMEALNRMEQRALKNGSEPPHNGGMEARVAKLEAIVPSLATKLDMAELRTELVRVEGSIRADMHKEFTSQTWRIIGSQAALVAVVYFVVKYVVA